MRCNDFERCADSLIDDELAEPERLECESHLAECPPCRHLVTDLARFKSLVRAAGPRLTASESLRRRIGTALDQADREDAQAQAARPPLGRWLPVAWIHAARRAGPALALGVVVLSLLSPGIFPGASESPVFEESILKHQRNLPLDITGAPEVVRSWFDGRVPFAVRTPRLEPMASLRGGRLITLGDRDAAYLIYETRDARTGAGKISVFVFDARGLPLIAPRREIIGQREVYLEGQRGYRVAAFRDNGVGYAIAGDIDEPDLIRLISSMR